jgi:uncharacterized protein
MAPFDELRRAGRVRHSLQTNATLVNDAWCDLFRERDVAVGVSIDGPADLNVERVDWAGRPAFDRIVAGIGKLVDRQIRFSLIAVVGEGIGRAEDLLDFLAGLGPTSIGLNIEELEGVNTSRTQPAPCSHGRLSIRMWKSESLTGWRSTYEPFVVGDARRGRHTGTTPCRRSR